MEPGEALSTAAQVAVALAGFAGVVVAFRRGSLHDWGPRSPVSHVASARELDRRRSLIVCSPCCFLTIEPTPAFHLALVQRVRASGGDSFRDADPAASDEK